MYLPTIPQTLELENRYFTIHRQFYMYRSHDPNKLLKRHRQRIEEFKHDLHAQQVDWYQQEPVKNIVYRSNEQQQEDTESPEIATFRKYVWGRKCKCKPEFLKITNGQGLNFFFVITIPLKLQLECVPMTGVCYNT